MNRLEVREYESLEAVPLHHHDAAALGRSRGVSVSASAAGPGKWDIKAANYVGLVQAGDTEVHIRPKVATRRLLFLVAYSLRGQRWQELHTSLSGAEDMVEAAAHAFSYFAESALTQGVLQGYVVVEESLPVLRGRLREADQMRRRFGLALPLEVTYDDFTVDIIENRLIKTAAMLLLRLHNVEPGNRRRLRRIVRKLEGVNPLHLGQEIPRIAHNRQNTRYREAMLLADLILNSTSIEASTSRTTPAVTFLFDMNKLFEDFVTRVFLSVVLHSGHWTSQETSYLDTSNTIRLRPDLTLIEDGRPSSVVDLKYKSLALHDLPNADTYQMLAYCLALGLTEGHLIYAAGNELPARRVVKSTGTEIVTWTIDLDQEPEELLSSISTLVTHVSRGATVAIT